MKINKLLLISFFAMAQYSFGQVKIGNDINTIDSASILELESTDKVLILTRVTNTQMNAITPLTGAMVYNTDEGCMFQYNGILWQSLCNTSSFNQTNTVIFDNNDGTFSYTNENNITVVITKAQLSDNGDGTFSFVNGDGTSINFDGTDNQNLTTDGNPGSLTLENGGSVTINVNDADADDTNELNTDFSLNGTALEITDADGTLSQDLDATFVTEAELTTNNTTTTAAINAVQTDVDNNEAAANTAITALQNDKENSANKSDVVTLGTSNDLFPTQNAVKTYVDNQVAGSTQVIVSTDADNDVTAGADGGAFYDDAALQTNIATNASNITTANTAITNVQDDVDANETAANTAIAAVQTDVDNNEAAANTAITLKEDSANKSDAVTLGTSDDLFPTQNAVKTYVDNQVAGSAQVIVSTDADNDVTAGADGGAFYDDAALQTNIATNATNITAANTAITDAQNDVDANETAANTAIAAVQTDVDNNEAAANTAITALQNDKENSANKSDVVTLGTSDDLFPTQNAVKTYVDNQVAGSAQVIVSTDADNNVTAGADGGAFYDDAALQTSIATNATNITAANTAITNVQNDVDANETAANTAIAAVQTDVDNNEADADAAINAANTAITALQNDKENSANKSDVVTLGTSDDLFPTQNAVKTYVDNQVAGSAQVIVSTDTDNDVTAGADGGAFYDDAALQTSIATNATNITAETTRATNAENAIQADVDANETAANTAIALKEDSANKSDAVTLGTSDDLFPTQNAVKTYVDNQVAGSAQVIVSTDADNDVTAGADGGAFYDDAALQTNIATNATNITAANTAITNVQNDVDANETAANTSIAAVQTDVDNNEAAANTAIALKENSANKSDAVTLGTSDDLFPTQNAVKTYVDNQVAGSAQVIVSTDADNDVTAGADGGAFYDDAALQTNIATNATNITAANTAITDVQNDVDANETAANTAIAAVQTDVDNNEAAANTAIALKEDSANKSDVVTLGTSDDLFPTQNAVKTYVDNQVAGSTQIIVSTDADNDVTAGADGGAFYDDAALQTSITTNATNITAANTAITNVQNDVDANETAANTAIAAVQTDVDNNEAAANTAIALKEDSANKSDVVTLGTSDDLFPTQNAVKTYVDNQVAGSAQVIVSTDADNDVTAGADGGAFYDDAALQTNIATNATNITAANTAITNVQNDVDANETAANTAIAAVQTDVDNNEADADAAITAANTAITALQNDKEDSANKSDAVTLGTSDDLFPTQNAVKTYVDNQVAGSAQVIVSTDADNDVTAGADGGAFYDDAALQTNIATNATNITAETTRATNAENAIQADVDANETAANTAIAAVQTDVDNNEAAANTAIALKENSANKSDVVTLGTSDDLFPTQNAVKTYVDNQVAGSAQVIVSTDADNDVTAGADGGAFYDDAALQTNIATNASNITAANTAITNVQNDVDANETAANTAIAAVQTDVDNNEADADAAITSANSAITALQNDKEDSANKSDVVTLGTSDDLFPTQNAVKTYVDNQVAGSAQVIVSTDADNDVTAGADGGAFYDDTALQTSIATNATNITAANTAITNVQNDVDANETAANTAIAAVQTDVDNNEADADAAITAANTAITALQNDKENSANKSDVVTLGTSDDLFPTQNAVKTYVDNQVAGSAQVIVSTDADNDVTAGTDGGAFYDDAALQTNIATNATNITAANTAITNVQNDVDANETAANTAIAAVQTDVDNNEAAANTAIALKEDSANKSDVVTLGTSDDLFPTQNAVKTYVDNQVAGSAQVIVSTDADNDVTAGADGGAFYDDAALQTNIATNATNITAETTRATNAENAIQADVDANETAANTAIAAVQTDVDNNEAAANTAIALKENSANKSDVVTLGTSDDLFPTQNAVKTYVDNQVAGSTQVIVSTDADNDVTAGADGGAFYDDAALQTSIATNASNITAETTRATNAENAIQADIDANETAANTAIAAVQTDVDNNEAAANTAITTLQNDKEDSANKSDVVTLGTSDDLFPTQNAVKTYVDNQVAGSAQVIVSTDADNDVTAGADGGAFYDDAALQTSIATNASNITAANTAITDVQNDVDANETAANTAIAAVQTDVDSNEAAANTAIALKEDSANKSDATDLGDTTPSTTLFPTQNAVKTYVDTQISGIVGGTVTSLTQDNSTGVISYVNESVVTQTADVISADTGNHVKAGTDGGAFYSSMVKALGKVNALGVVIKGTTGVTVVKQLGVGHYRVNLPAGTVSDANYIIQLSQPGRNGAGNDDPGISYSNQTSTGFDVIVGDNDNGGTDRARFDSEFMFVILDL